MVAWILLMGSAVAIYLSCEFFVNGVEWAGRRLGVSQNATGSVLAAFGTALPESVVTFVAVVFGSGPTKELGVGAAIGGPLALSTIAYGVVGLTFLLAQARQAAPLLNDAARRQLISDQQWFMVIFIAKIALGLIVFAWKPWLGVFFLLAYGLYVRQQMQGVDAAELAVPSLDRLKFRPHDAEPSTFWVLFQTLAALVVIFFSSQVFVHQLEVIGPRLGISPQIVALLLSPIATELPEILNAVIWVRQGKQTLALSNISGAMMIQATIPSALGMFFTPWLLGTALQWAAAVTTVSILGLFALLKAGQLTGPRLAWFGALYAVFAAGFAFISFA